LQGALRLDGITNPRLHTLERSMCM